MLMCDYCRDERASVRRPKNGRPICRACFLAEFESDVHRCILRYGLFKRGETVAVGVSGGKDSSVVLHVLNCLNRRHDYGVNLVMVAIDEGIVGYRDHSLEAVQEQQKKYGLPLKILSYDQLFGWTMDRVVELTGKKGNCTYCGVFRRQSLEKGAAYMGASKLVTGHNADDAAETILMNLLRGDIARLQRCTHPLSGASDELPRVKPMYFCYEKEIVMYARYQNLKYFATECIYAPNSYRGNARTFIKQLERLRPRSILDILASGQFLSQICINLRNDFSSNNNKKVVAATTTTTDDEPKKNSVDNRRRSQIMQQVGGKLALSVKSTCTRCGSISSQSVCYACSLLDVLNKLGGAQTDVEYIKIKGGVNNRVKEKATHEILAIEDLGKDKKSINGHVTGEFSNVFITNNNGRGDNDDNNNSGTTKKSCACSS